MLPMLLSFLGAGLAKTGALGTFLASSPLIAGSIGAGLGRTAETGSLNEGIKAGFGSFLGGTALGALGNAFGGGAGAGAATAAKGIPTGMYGPPTAMQAAAVSPGATSAGFLSPLQTTFQGGMDFGRSAAGLGSMMGSALASPPQMEPPPGPSSAVDPPTFMPYPREPRKPPRRYRPGYDPEFNYFVPRYAMGGTVSKMVPGYGVVHMQAGGIADLAADTEIEPEDGGFEIEQSRMAGGNEKTVIVDAIRAIKNMHPQPEIALATFVQSYGEDALRDLVDRVQSGEFDETVSRFADGKKGVVRGPGDGSGTDDMVPATIDGEQDVLLSDGEFVVRKDSTDALEDEFGDGFMDRMNRAGARAPDAVREMVMQ